MQRTSGFTLLELLVVLIVLGMLAALVSPMVSRQLDRSEQRREIAWLQASLRQQSQASWLYGRAATYRFEGAVLTRESHGDPAGSPHRFDHLRFPVQVIRFNTRGTTDVPELVVELASTDRRVALPLTGMQTESRRPS